MEQLPEELLLAVLSLLDSSSLVRAAAVCRQWHRLTADPVLASRLHLHLTPAQLLLLPCRAKPGSCVVPTKLCVYFTSGADKLDRHSGLFVVGNVVQAGGCGGRVA